MADTLPATAVPSLTPRTFAEAKQFAEMLAKSAFVPKDFKDRPDDILIAMQMGSEIGLGMVQSVQSIAVINGRPTVWGDAMLALCWASGKMKSHKEYFDDKGTAVCEVARIGDIDENDKQIVHVVKFSDADIEQAGLKGKGVHATYPKRMKQFRARGFALRDKFPDVLKGIISREEAQDYDVETTAQPTGELLPDEQPKPVMMVPDNEPVQRDSQHEAHKSSPTTDGSETAAPTPTPNDKPCDPAERDRVMKKHGELEKTLRANATTRIKKIPGFNGWGAMTVAQCEAVDAILVEVQETEIQG